MLQIILLVLGFSDSIIVDGDYGEETAKGVMALQMFLGVEVDGNFGPATREAFKEVYKLDIDAIPASLFQGETTGVGP